MVEREEEEKRYFCLSINPPTHSKHSTYRGLPSGARDSGDASTKPGVASVTDKVHMDVHLYRESGWVGRYGG